MDGTLVTADDRRSPPPPGWHTLSPESAMGALRTEAVHGLSEAAAAARLRSAGPNGLPAPRTAHPFVIFLRQFRSPLAGLIDQPGVVEGNAEAGGQGREEVEVGLAEGMLAIEERPRLHRLVRQVALDVAAHGAPPGTLEGELVSSFCSDPARRR